MGQNRELFWGVAVGTVIGLIIGLAVVVHRARSGALSASSPDDEPLCGHWAVRRTCELLGAPVTMDEIRKRMPARENGHNLLEISTLLEEVGFEVEARKETWETLQQGQFPCIVHFNQPEHFTVVSSVSAGRVHLFDTEGRRTAMLANSFNDRFSGNVLWVRKRSLSDAYPAFAGEAAAGAPRIQFDTLLLDRGNVAQTGEDLLFRFPFRNLGGRELLVKNVRTGCDCIQSHVPVRSIAPGKGAIIELTYHPASNNGPFYNEATVETNDPLNPSATLKLTGYSDWHLDVSPKGVWFGNVVPGRKHEALCFVRSPDQAAEFEILGVQCSVAGTTADFFRTTDHVKLAEILPPGVSVERHVLPVWCVVVSFQPDESRTAEAPNGTLEIITNAPGSERLVLPVRGTVVSSRG